MTRRSAEVRMDDVLWYARRLSQARDTEVSPAVCAYFERKYRAAVRAYINPFDVNKYVQ